MKKTYIHYNELIQKLSSENLKERRNTIEILSSIHEKDLYHEIASFLVIEDAIKRNSAIEILTAWGKNVTNILVEKTKTGNYNERIFSCNILGDIKDPSATEALLNLLTDEESNVKFAAYEAIGKIGNKEATTPLLQYLYSNMDNPWEQFPLIITLGQLSDEKALLPLLHLAENEMLKQPVLQAISNIADERAISYIIDALQSQDDYIQEICILTIKNMKDKVDKSKINQKNLINIISSYLNSLDKKTINNVLKILTKVINNQDYSLKIGCIFLLGVIGNNKSIEILADNYSQELELEIEEAFYIIKEKDISLLMRFLTNNSKECNKLIIKIFGDNKIQEANDIILKHLNSKSIDIKIQSAEALGKILDEKSIDKLLLLINNKSIDIKIAAINALKNFPSKKLDKKLKDILYKDDDNFIFIFELICSLNNSNNFNFLKKFVNHDDFKVRKNVAKALVKYNTEESRDILIKFLSDPNQQVKKEAILTLSEFGESSYPYIFECLFDNEPWVRYFAIKTFSKQKINEEVIKKFIDLLNDKSPFVVIAIIEALGEMKSDEFIKTLYHFVLSSDFNIIETAINALNNFNLSHEDEKKFLYLLSIQSENKDWIVRKAVAKALEKIKNNDSLELLLKMLAQENEDIVDIQILTSLIKQELNDTVISVLIEFLSIDNMRDKVIQTLSKSDEKIIPYLRNVFYSSDSDTKIAIISIISEINSHNSLNFLLKSASEDSSSNVRKHSILALNSFLKDQRALWAIMWSANNDSDFIVKQTAKMLLVS